MENSLPVYKAAKIKGITRQQVYRLIKEGVIDAKEVEVTKKKIMVIDNEKFSTYVSRSRSQQHTLSFLIKGGRVPGGVIIFSCVAENDFVSNIARVEQSTKTTHNVRVVEISKAGTYTRLTVLFLSPRRAARKLAAPADEQGLWP